MRKKESKHNRKMKKIKLFSIAAAFVAAFAFTSCNTGDDNSYSYLTKEQQLSYQKTMAMGSYNNMKLIFDHKNAADTSIKTDSVDTYCNVSMYGDSIIRVANFPVAKIAEHIYNNKALADALAKESPRDITCKFMVLPNSTDKIAYLYACPTDIELNLAYGESNEAHKVVLRFTYSPYQYGVCLLTTKEMGFAFYLNQIYVDGKPTDYIQSTTTSKKYVAFLCQPAWKKK